MGEPEPRQEVPDTSHNQSRPVWWELGSPFSLLLACGLQGSGPCGKSRTRQCNLKQMHWARHSVQQYPHLLYYFLCNNWSQITELNICTIIGLIFFFFFFFASTTSPALQTLSSMKAGLESALLAVVTEHPPRSVIPS